MFHSVGSAAARVHIGHKPHCVHTRLAVSVGGIVLRIGAMRSGAVAEIPQHAVGTAIESKLVVMGKTFRRRIGKVGHGEIAAHIETENRIIAIIAVIGGRPRTRSGGKRLVAATTGTHRLIERGAAVKSAGAAVHMVIAAAFRSVLFAKESGIYQSRRVGIDAKHIEILSVGGILVGIGGDGHPPSAVGVPWYRCVVGTYGIACKFSSPTGGINTVANIGSKGRGGKIGLTTAGTHHGGPPQRIQVGSETGKKLPAVGHIVVGVVNKGAACGLGLAKGEHIVVFSCTHKVALVVGRRAEERACHQGGAVIGNLCQKAVGATSIVGGVIAAMGGGKIGGIGAATYQKIVLVVHVDRIDGIVAGAAKIAGPQKVGKIIVQFKHHAILSSGKRGAETVGSNREVSRLGGGSHINVGQIVGNKFAAGTVSIVEIERIVAQHLSRYGCVIIVFVVQSIVVAAANVGRGQELSAGGVKPTNKYI